MAHLRDIGHALDYYGVNTVLQQVYDDCGKRVGDRFVSTELFWEYIAVLAQKEGRELRIK